MLSFIYLVVILTFFLSLFPTLFPCLFSYLPLLITFYSSATAAKRKRKISDMKRRGKEQGVFILWLH